MTEKRKQALKAFRDSFPKYVKKGQPEKKGGNYPYLLRVSKELGCNNVSEAIDLIGKKELLCRTKNLNG